MKRQHEQLKVIYIPEAAAALVPFSETSILALCTMAPTRLCLPLIMYGSCALSENASFKPSYKNITCTVYAVRHLI